MAPTNTFSILLLVLTPLSYFPQLHRIWTLKSSNGIFLWSVFLQTLVFQAQLASFYYLFRSRGEMRFGVPVATPLKLRDWVNAAQVGVLWICSLGLFVLTLLFSSAKTRTKALGLGLLVFHAVLFGISIPIGGRSQDIVFIIIRNVDACVVHPLMVLGLLAAIVLQTRAAQGEALSRTSILFQILIFTLLAVSWPFRLILPKNLWESRSQPALLMEWYPWVGWVCVNSVVFAAGQIIVLWKFTGQEDGERQPLLGA